MPSRSANADVERDRATRSRCEALCATARRRTTSWPYERDQLRRPGVSHGPGGGGCSGRQGDLGHRSGGLGEPALASRGPTPAQQAAVDGDPLMRLMGRVVRTDLPDECPKLAAAIKVQLQLERQQGRRAGDCTDGLCRFGRLALAQALQGRGARRLNAMDNRTKTANRLTGEVVPKARGFASSSTNAQAPPLQPAGTAPFSTLRHGIAAETASRPLPAVDRCFVQTFPNEWSRSHTLISRRSMGPVA